MKIDNAAVSDATAMHQLINHFADRGDMLARALSDIYENIRDYFVIRDDGQLIACAALHVKWLDLAEIRSLAVEEKYQNQGIGSMLVQACVDEARRLGIRTIFSLTYKPLLFEKCDFQLVDKLELPRKVWTECYRCPKFPNCDEVALVRRI